MLDEFLKEMQEAKNEDTEGGHQHADNLLVDLIEALSKKYCTPEEQQKIDEILTAYGDVHKWFS